MSCKVCDTALQAKDLLPKLGCLRLGVLLHRVKVRLVVDGHAVAPQYEPFLDAYLTGPAGSPASHALFAGTVATVQCSCHLILLPLFKLVIKLLCC